MTLNSRFLGWAFVLCMLTNSLLATEVWNIFQDDAAAEYESPWGKIQPSSELKWESCYEAMRAGRDPLECAKLEIPLNWNDTADPSRVTLAVIRKPARNSTAYKGPVFLNPGGPGSSGVSFLVGNILQRMLIPTIGEDYDIVSWDPRGVGLSTPSADCWNDSLSNYLWTLNTGGKRLSDAEPQNLYQAYAIAKAQSAQCESAMKKSRLLQFVGATYDARDLLELVNKYGNTTKLNYWGFSYGTAIGSLFAAMYPDKVGRIVNDGNVNMVERLGPYKFAVHDINKVLDEFYRLCSKSGASECAISEKTADGVKARVQRLKEKITAEPYIVHSGFRSADNFPVIVSWADVEDSIYSGLYEPESWGTLSRMLARLENGTLDDERSLLKTILPPGTTTDTNICEKVTDASPSRSKTTDANAAVSCADALPIDGGLKGFEEFVSLSKKANPDWAMRGANSRLACAGRTVRPKWRYSGPVAGNTSHPILFVGNRYDAITPLSESYNTSSYFPGSVVLLNDGHGHTSLNAPSNCTMRYINQYFQDGTLPAPGTVCRVNKFPFDLPSGS